MHPGFAAYVSQIDRAFAELISTRPVLLASARFDRKVAGVYMLSEANRHLFVGRTQDIGRRLFFHLRGRAHQAPLARSLAIESLRQSGVATPMPFRNGNRSFYRTDEAFLSAFASAKRALAPCLVRWIEEPDPVKQCFLEVYAATTLSTPYNDFRQMTATEVPVLRAG